MRREGAGMGTGAMSGRESESGGATGWHERGTEEGLAA